MKKNHIPCTRFMIPVIVCSMLLVSCREGDRVDISKSWRMTTGDSSEYRDPSYDDSSWETIDLPRILSPEKKRKVTWLRKTFTLPIGYSAVDAAVEIGKIWDADETYINGIKIGSTGSEFPDFFSSWNYDRYYMIPANTLHYGGKNVISIRVYTNCISFFEGKPFISSLRAVSTYNFIRRLYAEYLVIGLTLLSVFFGLISMVSYISYRKNRMPLYYSACALLIGIMSIQFYLPDIAYISYITKDNIFYTLMTLVVAFFYFLIENLLYTQNRVFRTLIVLGAICAVSISLTSTADDPVQGWRISVIGMLTFMAYMFGAALLVRSIIREVNREVIIILIGFALNMTCMFHDIFMMENIISPGTFLIPVGFNLLYVSLGIVLSLRNTDTSIKKAIAEQARDYYINEINLAKKIQDQMIPSRPPEPCIHSLYRPMEDVGGDFFDFVRFKSSDSIGIFISDVSGHGLAAAFITSMVKTTILQSGARREDPAELLRYMNDVLYDQTAGNFITAFYGIYDPASRILRYANAGHPQPFVITSENVTQLPRGRSTAVALFHKNDLARMGKEYVNFEEQLPAGSRLLLYTDGLIEARSLKNGGTFFENRRMAGFLMKNRDLACGQFIDNLYGTLVEFRGSKSFEDDICLVCLDVS